MKSNCAPTTADFYFTLPPWAQKIEAATNKLRFDSDKQKMEWVLALARHNITDGGGPFAAAIFAIDSGALIAPGINQVMACNCSVLHAEITAIILAQKRLGSYTLSLESGPGYELVTSTEPCAMCLGAIPWAGLKRVVCGARDEDARAVGFDEGNKPEHWIKGLKQRGIHVTRDILRTEAAAVLQEYVRNSGEIYNGN